ncbi:MAG TPA: LON peptidase substrate-binding domain-containing protein, partial [Candidatus Sulfotelmatobacter sp.]|nr:LON peptidase substrate-binding domain-containing protein [Candidatus Sulfotelmatobacter sp.]
MEKVIPIIPIRDGIIFPNTDSVLTFGRPKSLAALESSFSQERTVVFVLQKNSKLNEPNPSDLYNVGTLSHIERMIKSDGEINAQVKGLSRVAIMEYVDESPFLMAKVQEVEDIYSDTPEIKALTNHLIAEFKRAINLGKFVDFLVFMNVMSENTPSALADLAASVLDLKPQEKQTLLVE